MPLATLACTIDATGISAPSYEEIYASLQEKARTIYGSDIAITPDTQDGQMLAIYAQGIHDSNQVAIAVYNSIRPSYAQGTALDGLVKINGIARALPSKSAADGDIIGVSGTTINNGIVQDQNGHKWDLPEVVVIPEAGVISVTVTAQEDGGIVAPVGTISQIATPTLGWQEFASTTDSLPGSPVETDAALRRRQTTAAALTSKANLAGILAALEDLDGVTRVRVYENDSGGVDANGLVAHSIAVVIEGGDDRDIAETIGQEKAGGCALNGTTVQSYTDPLTSVSYNISFYRLATDIVPVTITLQAASGWNDSVEAEIKQSISDYISGLDIGEDVQFSRMFLPAYLNGGAHSTSFHITAISLDGGVIDVVIAFNAVAVCTVADVIINVIP